MSWFVPPAKYRGKNETPCRGLYQGKKAILAEVPDLQLADIPASITQR